MRVYKDEEGYIMLMERREEHRRRHGVHEWVGRIEMWVDQAHTGEHVKGRLIHGIKCMLVYNSMIHRPEREERKRELEVARKKRHAWWPVLACAMRMYMQD